MLNSFDKIEKIYCINLPKRTDRKQECDLLFKKHNLTVEYENACDGKIMFPNKSAKTAARMGCTQSHINVLNKIKQNKFEYSLILEDDIEFDDDLIGKFNNYIQQLPEDFCVLYLGGNHIISPVSFSENLVKCVKTYCLHSYIINQKYINYILSGNYFNHEVLDVYFANDIQNKYPCYTFTPKLTWQRESYSDIEQRKVFYRNIK